MMRAKWMKKANTTSNLSNREKLQEAFLQDCRVEEVFGPDINRDKAANWVSPDTKSYHRDHIHITAWEPGKSTCTE